MSDVTKSLDAQFVALLEGQVDNLIMEKMELLFEERDPMVIDLTQSAEEIKKTRFQLKRGAKYKVRLSFRIKNRTVTRMQYHERIYRTGITVEKTQLMVGNFGPKDETQVAVLESDNWHVTKGDLSRDLMTVKSKVLDDLESVNKSWEWSFVIRSEWA